MWEGKEDRLMGRRTAQGTAKEEAGARATENEEGREEMIKVVSMRGNVRRKRDTREEVKQRQAASNVLPNGLGRMRWRNKE